MILLLWTALAAGGINLSFATYTRLDSGDAGGPDYQWIEIRQSGEAVLEGAEATGGATVQLPVPIVFYEEVVYKVVVSVEGYLSTDPADTGDDATPDVLPQDPNNGGGGRLYPCHANLAVGPSSPETPRGIFYEYFRRSPHSHYSGGVHVFQWEQANFADGGQQRFSFQMLVFDNGDILMQYKEDTPLDMATRSYTVGIQRRNEVLGHSVFHDGSGGDDVSSGLAVLFEPPTIIVTTTEEPAPPLTVNLRNAVETVSRRDTVHKIEFSPTLSGDTTELNEQLRFPCIYIRGIEPVCARCPALILDASNLPQGHRILAQDMTGPIPGYLQGQWLIGSEAVGNPTSDFYSLRVTPPYFHFNNLDIEGNDARILIQDSPTSVSFVDCALRGIDGGVVVFNDYTGAITPSIVGQIEMRGCEVSDCGPAGNNQALFSLEEYMPHPVASGTGIVLHDTVFRDNESIGFTSRTVGAGSGLGRPNIEIIDCKVEGNGIHKFMRMDGADSVLIRDSSFMSDGLTLNETRGGSADITIEGSFFGGLAYDASAGSARAVVRNSTFSGGSRYIRQARSQLLSGDDLFLQNCTFVRAPAESLPAIEFRGNGVFLFKAEKSIFTGGAFGSDHFSVGASVTLSDIAATDTLSDRADPEVATNAALTGIDPLLLPLAMNGGPTLTHMPQAGSAAIDGGSAKGEPVAATDQRGENRLVDFDNDGTAQVDIGAVEATPLFIVTTVVDEIADPGTGDSLREVLNAAPAGARVTFASSIAGQTITVRSALSVTADVRIDASKLSAPMVLSDPQNRFNILDVEGGVHLAVENVQFTGGLRAIFARGGSMLELTDVQIEGADSGGADGGGILASSGAGVMAKRIEISGCKARRGAGIFAISGDVMLEDSWIHDCEATLEGGGLFAGGGVTHGAHLFRCAFTRNKAEAGAGYYKGVTPFSVEGLSRVSACTFGENEGGAIHNEGGPLFVRFSTIHRNTGHGGVAGTLDDTTYYHVLLTGNLVDGQLMNMEGGSSEGYNLEDGDEGIFIEFSDRILTDARLTPLGWHGGPTPTYAPLAGSPAINGGDQQWNVLGEFQEQTEDYNGPLRDQRGFSRPRVETAYNPANGGLLAFGPLPDIGAVEVFEPIVVDVEEDQNDSPAGAETSLREALRDCPDGGRIMFDPELSGVASHLKSGPLLLQGKSVMVDATALPRGFRLFAKDTRCLEVEEGTALSVHAVSFAAVEGLAGGGGIVNEDRLLVTRAAIYGAIATGDGGGILHDGEFCHVENCTISGNVAEGSGGAIAHRGSGEIRVRHSTIYQNQAADRGPGIYLGDADLHLELTAFEDNGTNRGDVLFLAGNGGLASGGGYNLEDASDLTGPTNVSGEQAGFQPLADNGGHALSHWFRSNSPIVDAKRDGLEGHTGTDQLGGRRVLERGVDVGAIELGGYFAWVATESNAPEQRDLADDPDGNGIPNGLEYLLITPPVLEVDANGAAISFTTGANIFDVDFQVEASGDLGLWTIVYKRQLGGNTVIDWLDSSVIDGGDLEVELSDPAGANADQTFLRMRVWLR